MSHQSSPQDAPSAAQTGAPVRVGVIGTGHFATAVITQSQSIPQLHVPIVADLNIEAAQRAYARAGIAEEDVVVCDSRRDALAALERGRHVIVQDALLLMELPLDVIVESTGVPEAGARHASAAIEHGKHVAMVSKETDAVVGPILAHRARRAGVVYTPVDGDQHGLLIEMVAWARGLGLEVLCGGKARDAEFVYDLASGAVHCGDQRIELDAGDLRWLSTVRVEGMGAQALAEHLHERHRALADLPGVGGFDLVEMAIAANATGLQPDRPYMHDAAGDASALARRLATDARLTNRGSYDEDSRMADSRSTDAGRLHAPALHTAEIPQVLCSWGEGGILHKEGVIETVTCLRQPHEAGLGGGVFIVVSCANDYSRYILTTKGLIPNMRDSAALIYRPYHLCGVETPLSILRAARQGAGTLTEAPRPHVDVIMRTTRAMRSGDMLGNDHAPGMEALMAPAQPVQPGVPLPLHMGNGNPLRRDIAPGTVITAEMVAPPDDSVLWALRREQDQLFLEQSSH